MGGLCLVGPVGDFIVTCVLKHFKGRIGVLAIDTKWGFDGGNIGTGVDLVEDVGECVGVGGVIGCCSCCIGCTIGCIIGYPIHFISIIGIADILRIERVLCCLIVFTTHQCIRIQ